MTIDHYFTAQRWASKTGVLIFTDLVRNFILAILLALIFYYSLTLPLLQLIRSITAVDLRAPADDLLEISKHIKRTK